MSVSDFLRELQAKQSHCAAVVDEHGTVIGLAFREDALEEIVGPLGDEFDQREREFAEVGDGIFEVHGRMSLPEICDRLEIELPDEEYEDEDTIGGHVTARLGRLARRGDQVTVGPYLATVLDAGRRRVQRVRLERPGRRRTGDHRGERRAARPARGRRVSADRARTTSGPAAVPSRSRGECPARPAGGATIAVPLLDGDHGQDDRPHERGHQQLRGRERGGAEDRRSAARQ